MTTKDRTGVHALLFIVVAIASALSLATANAISLPVVNGDFETDADGSEGASGWDIQTGGTATHFWTSAGLPQLTGGLDPDTGQGGAGKFLSPCRTAPDPDAASNPANSFASQTIDLSSWAPAIDVGAASLSVGFYYSNGKNTDERSVVSVEFLDGSEGTLDTATTGDLPQTAEGGWSWSSVGSTLLAIPEGARSFTITLNQRRIGGTATNAGFDTVVATVFVTNPPMLKLAITPNPLTPGNYDFRWTSREGCVYDLVSSTDLSTPLSTWPVWQGLQNIAATAPENTLTGISGGDDVKRFFAVVEKAP